jgi:hypothetical protein
MSESASIVGASTATLSASVTIIDFVTAIKATIDYYGVAVASAMGDLAFLDLDDSYSVAQVLETDDPAVVWQMLYLDEDPVDPMYKLAFVIGAKTVNDPGNYALLRIVDSFRQVFVRNDSIDIYDYSSLSAPTLKLGYMFFTGIDVEAHVSDQQAGYRFATVTARVVRF